MAGKKNGTANGAAEASESKRGGANFACKLPLAPARVRDHLHRRLNDPAVLHELETLREQQKVIKAAIRVRLAKEADPEAKAEPGAAADSDDDLDLDAAAPTGDKVIDAAVKKIPAAKVDAEAKKNPKFVKLGAECDALTKQVVRIGGSTPVAIAAVLSQVCNNLMEASFKDTLGKKLKIVKVCNLMGGGPETTAWAFVEKLSDVVSHSVADEKTRAEARAAHNKLVKEYNDDRKALEAAKKADTPAADLPTVPDQPKLPVEEVVPGTPTTNFVTYIGHVVDAIKEKSRLAAEAASTKDEKAEDPYKSLRVSQRLREFMSNLVVQAIQRFAENARILVVGIKGVRTLNTSDFLHCIRSAYVVNRGAADEGIVEFIAFADEKVGVFTGWIAEDAKRKTDKKAAAFEALPAEKQEAIRAAEASAAAAKKTATLARKKVAAQKAATIFKKARDDAA